MYSKTGIARCCQPNCGCKDSAFVWISQKQHLIWYEVPKAASSTIKWALGITRRRRRIFGDSGYVNTECTPLQAAQRYDGYFKFAIVRDPWDRMVSNWAMFCGQPNSFRNKQIETLFGLRNARIDFRHFVQLAASIPSHHWEQSVKFLPLASDNKLVLDVLGTFDRIEESVAEISKKSGLKLGLTRKNTTSHKHYTRYYNSGTIELVASMFADDIAILGFEFGRI